ncbi:sugar porter family MFS transporter [Jiulongibacter sediminis]|jgi:sugar porter (SP) family MFS transporter|uniref:sugar porter family MFS transporter n=1 Tax=Jiulongibacter sediminis TaxID=1605367 RepID=UPI0026EDE05A|nr:sugar porter family MFS transporter [Jiulongibacter sediminis]
MNNKYKLIIWSISAALGGFLFGFDTAVISGVEQTLQNLWQSTTLEHGLTVSIALIGTVLGSLIGGYPTERLGRRSSLFIVAVLYVISALGSAYAIDWVTFLIFRLLGGLGVGISSVVAPMYISEIAPPSKRGRLVALFQFNVVFGILMAYLSNYIIGDILGMNWRWMLGIEAIPALVFLFLILGIPESPRWLILNRNLVSKAKETLSIIDPQNAENTIQGILSSGKSQSEKNSFKDIFNEDYRKPLLLAVLFAVFNQTSGINAIIYYAPRIFEMAGLGSSIALLSSAGIGLVNLIFTLVGLLLIDRFGRRFLMTVGSLGLILTLLLVAFSFLQQNTAGYSVPIYLFLFMAFFAMSQGAVIWVFISEIFPNRVRANGQALGSFTHWLLAALISFSFPYFAETFGGATTFGFFALMMVLQLLFVRKLMPETRGTALENLEPISIK